MAEGGPDTPDRVTTRLELLTEEIRGELGELVTIEVEDRDDWRAVDLRPTRPGALAVSWTDFYPWTSANSSTQAGALQVEAGHQGGWWELGRDEDDLAFLVDLVRSVVAGRVVEVFGPDRSRVEVTLSDGAVAVETGGRAPVGCLPVPGWVRRGRRLQYEPYR